MRASIGQVQQLIVAAAETRWPPAAGPRPRVDPCLHATYIGRLHQPVPVVSERSTPKPGMGHAWIPGLPGGGADPGLVGSAQFEGFGLPPPRYGFKGLTQKGRKALRQAGAGMEERRACCGFWTIALPDHCLRELMELDTWSVFQSSIRRRLAEQLRKRGVPALVAGVVELHPKRTADFARDLPHLHVLFRGKVHRWQHWAMQPSDFDLIVRWALWDADVIWLEDLTGCKVEPVKKSVRRYLAKYLTKGPPSGTSTQEDNSDARLIPRQWWFESRESNQLRKALTISVPAEWLAFLLDRRKANAKGQLFHAWVSDQVDSRAPTIWNVAFRSPWALFLCWEAYEKAIILGERPPPRNFPHGST